MIRQDAELERQMRRARLLWQHMPAIWGTLANCLETFERIHRPATPHFRLRESAGVQGAYYMVHKFPELAHH